MSSRGALDMILEKVASKDKDFRYMAASDLQGELAKEGFQVEGDSERRLVQVVLQQLEDPSGDIQNLAVKCLGLLVRKIKEGSVEDVAGKLAEKLTAQGKKNVNRDTASIGLKEVIREVGSAHPMAPVIARVVTPKMLTGLQSTDDGIKSDSLEVTQELLSKYGGLMPVEQHEVLQDALLPMLDEQRGALRKRAINVVAALAMHLNDGELRKLAEAVLKQLQAKGIKPDTAVIYIQLLGSVSRAVAYRFGQYLDTAVPLVLRFSKGAGDGEEELSESCLQALESFVSRSPGAMRPHLQAVLPPTLAALSFDPNYAEDMDADEDNADDDEDAVDELSDDQYSDDEDVSWKVRRAAAKTLAAILTAYPELLGDLYPQAAPALRARFREREETVKADVFSTFTVLLQQVGVAAKRSDGDNGAAALGQLRSDVPAVLRAAAKQLREKPIKTRMGAFGVLRELVLVMPEAVTTDPGLMVPGIVNALNDNSSSASNLKMQALLFLHAALDTPEAAAFQPSLPELVPPVLAAVAERYYRVSAQALRVTEQMVHIIRPDPGQSVPAKLKALVAPIHGAVAAKLAGQDQDQEVKDAAIAATAALVATLGDELRSQVPALLQVLVERLRNEITRLMAVKALADVARSPLALPLDGVLAPALPDLTSFLRKANRQLRQASLSALQALVESRGEALDPGGGVNAAVGEAAELVSDSDLTVTAQTLQLATAVLRHQPAAGATVARKVLPAALALAKSPLLQGSALEALQAFFSALPACEPAGVSSDSLLASLLKAGQAKDAGKGAQQAIAQCLAVVCCGAGQQQVVATVKQLLRTLQGQGGSEAQQRLALLALGSIGRTTDLSSYSDVQPVITGALQSDTTSEDVKGAAALALGGVAVGNLGAYLPSLLTAVRGAVRSPKDQYLLLRALDEVLASLLTLPDGVARLHEATGDKVLQLLLASTEAEEEVRGVLAECLGHLALLDPASTLPALRSAAADGSPAARAAVVTAVKHAVVEAPHAVDAPLQAALPGFLAGIQDPDRHVRRAAAQTLSTAAHVKPGLLGGQLAGLLPALYAQTVVDPSLIRTVDLGPFKHKIDDGLELRKAAFECMDVLLEECPHSIEFGAFIQHLESGLADHYDVKMPCHLLLGKLAGAAPDQVRQALPRLVDPLQRTLHAKVKTDAVKQEVDRNEDMLRSCLRAVEAISRIPGVNACEPWRNFMQKEITTPAPMQARYKAVMQERQEADGVEAMDI